MDPPIVPPIAHPDAPSIAAPSPGSVLGFGNLSAAICISNAHLPHRLPIAPPAAIPPKVPDTTPMLQLRFPVTNYTSPQKRISLQAFNTWTLIMSRLLFLVCVVIPAVRGTTTTNSSSCEDFGYKVENINISSGLVRDDPCFGYDYDCCDEYKAECYWKVTTRCTRCRHGYYTEECPACCDSYDAEPTVEPTDVPSFVPTFLPTSDPSVDPTVDPSVDPSIDPTIDPSVDPSIDPTLDPTNKPSTAPTRRPTDEPTPFPVNVTPSPTMHSAKKWGMVHPNYKGGDGELLWNIYYGDLSGDERFDSFRADQLWDADVIRPIIEDDNKYQRFQLANVAMHNSRSVEAKRHWSSLTMTIIFVSLMAITVLALVFWYKHSEYEKIADSTEKQALLQK